MNKKILYTALALSLYACSDSHSDNSVTNNDSTNSPQTNATNITWDYIWTDQISISKDSISFFNQYVKNHTYSIIKDTLYISYPRALNEQDKYIRIEGNSGSILGRWRFQFSGTGTTKTTNKFTADERYRFDSLVRVGQEYAQKGGGISEIEFTDTSFTIREFYGNKPAYMDMAMQFSPYYCSVDSTVGWPMMYCRSIVSNKNPRYIPSVKNDFTFNAYFIEANEMITFQHSSRKNTTFDADINCGGIYSSSNANHQPITFVEDGSDNYLLKINSWMREIDMW